MPETTALNLLPADAALLATAGALDADTFAGLAARVLDALAAHRSATGASVVETVCRFAEVNGRFAGMFALDLVANLIAAAR